MSLFTSLYEHNHGVKKNCQLSSQINFLTEELSKSFITRSINGGGWVKALFGFYRGFDYYKSYARCGPKRDSAKTLFSKAIEDLKYIHFPNTFYFLHCYQIHSPYQPRQRFLTYFNPSPKHTKLITPISWNNQKVDSQKLNEFRKAAIDLYDGEIRTFDYWFGEFIKHLKKTNIYDTSMIVLISDHGEEFNDHGKWGHNHSLYNEVCRVPLIIKFPKNKFKQTVIKNEVGLIDVMPTIMRYYGTKFNPESINGQDLLSVIKGKPINRSLFSSISNGMYSPKDAFKVAVFKGFTKIIYNLPYKKAMSSDFSLSSKKIEVFDLIKDPNEMRNLNLKGIKKIKNHQKIFDDIIKKGINFLKRKGKSTKIDKKTRETLKTLGYL
jgi:arylsulfatase A-like enzyme